MASLQNKISDKRLLTRIVENSKVAEAPQQKMALKFLWEMTNIREPLTSKLIAEEFYPRTGNEVAARKLVADLRKSLARYFNENVDEKFAIVVDERTYRVRFIENKPTWNSAGAILDEIWKPFLSPHLIARLRIGDLDLWDMKPKAHWSRGRMETEVRGELSVKRGEMVPYLPAGLISAAMGFSRYLKSLGVRLEFDLSLKSEGPVGSIIVIGKDPFPNEHPTWPTNVDCEIVVGKTAPIGQTYFDQLQGRDFTCYAKVERTPVMDQPGLVKISINASHSIAVEAAAQFLTSERSVRQIVSRVKPGTKSMPDFLGFILKVNCRVTDQNALSLSPGIPRIFLHIRSVELKLVSDRSLEVLPAGVLTEDQTQTENIREMMMGAERGDWIDDLGEDVRHAPED